MFLRFTLSAVLAATRLVSAAESATEKSPETPVSGTDTVHGCYSTVGSMKLNGTVDFNTQGKCNEICRGQGKLTAASYATDCYCGDKYPPLNTLLADDKCDEPCPGFGTDACGGLNAFTIYNTGVRVSVADEANTTSSSTSSVDSGGSTKTTQPAVVTVSGGIVTETPSESGASSKGGSTNTVGIAVGVVVGVVALLAIVGVAVFFVKRRRNRDIEDEHRRNAAVNAFISGGKPPSSSGGLSISDQRLDPGMTQRRMSSGSIADEQDYSRRILRVTNA